MKFLPHALIIAVLAGLMQFIDLSSTVDGTQYFYAWAGFAAWACYFISGCTIKGGFKSICCWVAGVAASIAIFELIGVFGGSKAGICGAVTLVAFFVILFEKVPALDFIPGWFIAAACFFATTTINGGNYKVSIAPVLIAAVMGQVFGFVTVFLRGKYQAIIDGPTDASEEGTDPGEVAESA